MYLQARSREYVGQPLKVTLPPTGPVELQVKVPPLFWGKVVNKETGEPVAGAQVAGGVTVTRGTQGFMVQRMVSLPSVVTGEDGIFEIPLREPGQVRLTVSAANFAQAERTIS